MARPVVAIVGRPNVGKSTLFNALAGERISIVKDTPGVTRDRIYADISWLNYDFTMIDTGGIEPDSKDIILSQMREQAQIAIDTADVIVFLVDVKQGLQDSDSKVADMLRRSHKPVVLVVNKVDSFERDMADVYEFYNLGIGDPIAISASSPGTSAPWTCPLELRLNPGFQLAPQLSSCSFSSSRLLFRSLYHSVLD